MQPAIIAAAAVAASIALAVAASALRVIKEYERGVVLRLGRRGPMLAPGLRLILPLGIDRLTRVDMRAFILEVLVGEATTEDGVPVKLTLSVHAQVLNPLLAVTRVVDHRQSAVQVAQAAVREVVAHLNLRTLLLDQSAVREPVGQAIDVRMEPWGVRTTAVDVREVELPASLRAAMERQARALGEQRLQRERAEADLEAAQRIADAAAILATQPNAIQLRFLQALTELSGGNSTVVVLPLPMELVQPFIDLQGYVSPPRAREEGGGSESAQRPFGDIGPTPRSPRPKR